MNTTHHLYWRGESRSLTGCRRSLQSVEVALRTVPIDFFRRIEAVEIFIHDGIAVALQILLPEFNVIGVEVIFHLPRKRDAIGTQVFDRRPLVFRITADLRWIS